MKLEPCWTIRGNTLLLMLREAHDGANPDLVYLEMVVNAKRRDTDDDDK